MAITHWPVSGQTSIGDRWSVIRQRFFNGPLDTVVTLGIVALLAWLVPMLLNWAVFSSVLVSTDGSACRLPEAGACWAVVTERFQYIFLGSYPTDQFWRPVLVVALLLGVLWLSASRKLAGGRLAAVWLAVMGLTYILMNGGALGLPLVQTSRWGGLPVTMILAVFSLMAAMPLGVLLALGRRSRLPVVRWLCVGYVEFMRGVPLISVLFMASVMLPLFLPEGLSVDRILRALLAFTFFSAAYIAEVVRAGLQAIPRGQYEAAQSLGLSSFETYRRVILPQAFRIVIPALVNTFIDFFKDTSLILVVGLLDLFNTARSVLSDPVWLPFATEVYVFLGLVYFVFCFAMSKYSQRLERRL